MCAAQAVSVSRANSSPVGQQQKKQLSLAYEDLTVVPYSLIEKYTSDVEVLDLSHNQLKDVRFLSHFECLHTVILDHNRLDCLSALPVLPRLRVLWLNFNRLLNATLFVPGLARSCPGLRVLCLMGNELAPSYLNGGTTQQNANYRLYVISHFPELVYLDDQPVRADERHRAHAVRSHIAEVLQEHDALVARNSLQGLRK